jgi:hypothetical protein
VRTARMLVFFWMFSSISQGQDVLERIAQLQAESEVLNSPSCVLFDATRIEDKKGVISQTRSVGRRVVGPKGEVRVDVRVTMTDLNSDSENIEFQHYIRLDPNDYLYALRPFGGKLSVVDLEKSVKNGATPTAPHGFSNPFWVVIGGRLKFYNTSNGYAKVSAVDGIENAVRPTSDLKATGFRTFKFSPKTPWAVTSLKSFINPSRFDFNRIVVRNGQSDFSEDHIRNWVGMKNPKQYVKDWNVVDSSSVDWIEVDNVGVLPARIVCRFDGIPKIDDRKTDFEVNYFGYEFDIKRMEKLFDRNRFNDANIKEDFPIELILNQSIASQKALANSSNRKSKDR